MIFIIWAWRCKSINCFSKEYAYNILHLVVKQVRKQVILKLSCFSKSKRKESICLYSLSINKDYKNYIFLNLISKVQSCDKWIKTQVMINSEYTSKDLIDMKYAKEHHLNIQRLKHDMSVKDFNRRIIWITHYILVKLQFDRHVEYIQLLLHDLKEDYNIILRF